MPESQPRTERFRGRSPPDRPEWTVTTVCRCGTNRSEPATCAVTGATVALDEPHYYVTIKRETPGRFEPEEFDHLVVADGALGELEEWLDDD